MLCVLVAVAALHIVSARMCSNEMIPMLIERRQVNDQVFSSTRGCACSDKYSTYLVDDRRCVNDQELLNCNL